MAKRKRKYGSASHVKHIDREEVGYRSKVAHPKVNTSVVRSTNGYDAVACVGRKTMDAFIFRSGAKKTARCGKGFDQPSPTKALKAALQSLASSLK